MAGFVRAANPIWWLPDLIGQPLNDEFFISFLTNVFPYVPQEVFQNPDGTVPWANPLQFFPNGTLPDNLYFDESKVYRLEVRHGNTQLDPLIYEVNNFVPGTGTTPSSLTQIEIAENQATNPQFSNVNFTDTKTSAGEPQITFTLPGTYSLAPGWDLVLTGFGTCTVTQIILSGTATASAGTNNPPFALKFTTIGFTTADLIQTLNHNGAIWSLGAVGMSVTARADIVDQPLTLSYRPSVGVATTIFSDLVGIGNFATYGRFTNLNHPLPAPNDPGDPSTNNQLSTIANVKMDIGLPVNGTIFITNVQFMGQSSPLGDAFDVLKVPVFQQEPNERAIDHEFHVYSDELINKPKKSILVGWNFPLNPWQFTDPATVTPLAALTQYTADQTIVRQETLNGLLVNKNNTGERQNLLIKAVNLVTDNRFAIIQYIDPASIRPYWSYILSSLARMRIFTTHDTKVRVKLRLIYRNTLPPTIGAAEPITGWDANGDVLFQAGWTPIIPQNDPAYILPNAYANGLNTTPKAYPGFAYNKMQLPDNELALTTKTLGIVLYTMDPMSDALGTEDSIAFDKISLIPSQFAADAFPQTFDDVLKECEFYYEKSYQVADLPGTATQQNEKFAEMLGVNDGGNAAAIPRAFQLDYKTTKRAAPTANGIVVYTPNSANVPDTVRIYSRTAGGAGTDGDITFSANWQIGPSSLGQDRVYFLATNVTVRASDGAQNVPEGFILYHYVVKTRLGLTDG